MSQSPIPLKPDPLPHYSDLSKPQQDLFHKGFYTSHLGSLSIYMHSPTLKFFKSSFKPYLSSNQHLNFLSSACFHYSGQHFSFKHFLTNENSSKSTIEIMMSSPVDFKIAYEKSFEKFRGKDSEKLSIQKNKGSANLDICVVDRKTLSLSSVWEFKEKGCFGGATDLQYSIWSKEFLKRTICLWYLKEDHRAVLSFNNNVKKGPKYGSLDFSFWFSTFKDLKIAAFWSYNFESQVPASCLAADYQLSQDKSIKLRVLSDGRSGISYKTKLTDTLQIISSGQLNALDLTNTNLQFSFKIKLNQ